jgi:hypothetical protein
MGQHRAIAAKNLVTLALVLALAACAAFNGRGLVPGVSTAADVQALMGLPAEKISVADGDTVWYYPRQPFGMETYAVSIAPNGTMRSIEQRLTELNLRKLVPGVTTQAQARELLGPPWRVTRNERLPRQVWTYRMYNAVQVEHSLHVQFSDDGLVREVLLLRDWRDETLFRWHR